MAQHDYNIANQTGLEFRVDVNNALQAIVTQNSGYTEPTTTYPGMIWLDTSVSPPVSKQRNQTNDGWIITTLISGTNIKTINGQSILGAGNIALQVDIPTAVAGGTADAITADFTPDVALTDGTTVIVRAGAANTTTTPTFAPDDLAAKTIVKGNNLALVAGDIAGAGHWLEMNFDTTLDKWVLQNPAKGVTSSVVYREIQPVSASVAANALTVTLNPTTLDFRSNSLTSGAINTRSVASAVSLTISSGSTLGTINNVASRIAILAIDNNGTVELAAVNMAGGVNLDETTLINTTAEGGAGAADSATVIYSQAARTGVPFRVVGYVESTQATAGTWATVPTLIQGYGGQAMASMQSLGYGQTWQDVGGSRVAGTTYYNTTGRPILIAVMPAPASSLSSITVNGLVVFSISTTTTAQSIAGTAIIPPGGSYSVSGSLSSWKELR